MKRRRAPARTPAAGRAREIGGELRAERERRELSVEQVALAIRFSAARVLAVEEGRFDDLPPRPYARGIVAAYASLLGLQPEVADEYLANGEPPGPARRDSLFWHPRREGFNWRNWTVPIGCAAATGVFLVLQAAYAPEPVDLPAPRAAVPAAPRPARDERPEATAAAPDAGVAPDTADTGGIATASADAPAFAAGVRVLLRSEGTTWVDASVDGGANKRQELGPGQNLELSARERLLIGLGDAGVVRVKVDERDLGFIGFKDETKTGLTFTAQPPPARPAARPAGAAAAQDAGD